MSYLAAVLPEADREAIRGLRLPEDWDVQGWEFVGHHMTIFFGKPPKEFDGLVGSKLRLAIRQIGKSDKAVALKVSEVGPTELPNPENRTYHITLYVNRAGGGKPKDSNAITEWQDFPGGYWFVVHSVVEVCP